MGIMIQSIFPQIFLVLHKHKQMQISLLNLSFSFEQISYNVGNQEEECLETKSTGLKALKFLQITQNTKLGHKTSKMKKILENHALTLNH